jgi:hypothetical protein
MKEGSGFSMARVNQLNALVEKPKIILAWTSREIDR